SAQQADATLVQALQDLANANRALAQLKEADASALASNQKLSDLRKTQDDAAAALTAANRKLASDGPHRPVRGTRDPDAPFIRNLSQDQQKAAAQDRILQANARANLDYYNTAYFRARSIKRQDFERSPAFNNAQQYAAACARELAAVRAAITARLLQQDPSYKNLSEL